MAEVKQTFGASTSSVPAPMPALPTPAPARPQVKDRLRRSESPLRGEYGALNVSGYKPLFILKETWDDKPRSGRKPFDTEYHQVLDPRTKLLMYLYSSAVISELCSGIVEWKTPTEQASDEDTNEPEQEDKELGADQATAGDSRDESTYSKQMALLHADIAGWSADDMEDDEVLSIESSDDGPPTKSPTTIYYPLFPTPLIRNAEVRQKLKDMVDGKVTDDYYAGCIELATRMLADLTGVEEI